MNRDHHILDEWGEATRVPSPFITWKTCLSWKAFALGISIIAQEIPGSNVKGPLEITIGLAFFIVEINIGRWRYVNPS